MSRDHRVALDTETIPIVDDPDFRTAEHWTVFAIALGHAPPNGDVSVTVLFRASPTITSEGELINDAITWIADRTDTNTRIILTYNGKNYDIPVLKHRAARIDAIEPEMNVAERLSLLLETSDHVDLILDVKEREGDWVSLDDALSEFDIDADTSEWMGSKVTGSDMPEMGLELLTDRPNDDLRNAVRRYASSDVAPLFELHAKLTGDTAQSR